MTKCSNVIFAQRDAGVGFIYRLHRFGISRHLLLVSSAKALAMQIANQRFHLSVREFRTLDAGRRGHAFHRRYPAQLVQAFRREIAQGAPGALEFIYFSDQIQNFR